MIRFRQIKTDVEMKKKIININVILFQNETN